MARSKRKPSESAKATTSAAEDLDQLTESSPGSPTAERAADTKRSAKDAAAKKKRPAGGQVNEKAKDASTSKTPKKVAAAESARTGPRRVAAVAPNPVWLAPTAVALLILGLVYLVTYYLSSGQLPLPIGDWNLAAGFGVMLVGGGMLMFWK